MKRSGSIAMNDNKKFKPVDAPRPIALQKLPTFRTAASATATSATATSATANTSSATASTSSAQPQPTENGHGGGGAVSKPASVYDPRFNDLWSPD